VNIWESIKTALRALRSNKLRTALTMLGIIIGVAAVIAMVAIGQGAAIQIRDQFSSMGTNLLSINRGNANRFMGGPAATTKQIAKLTAADADAIGQRYPDTITEVAQLYRGSVTAKMGDKSWSTQCQGVSPEYETVAKRPIDEGRFITAQDNTGRGRVALIGRSLLYNLTGDRNDNALGKEMLINRVRFTIVGILTDKGSGAFGQDQDDCVLIPVSTAMRRVFNATSLSEIDVSCITEQDMDLATEEITTLMRERHKLHPPFPDNDDFNVRSQSQILQAQQATSGTMTSLLGGIALVSLLVGGIGIMNIMMVSVTERTREIGIRKAVGATRHDILLQFLIEAVVISLLGGMMGIALGIGIGRLAADVLHYAAVVQLSVVLLAVAVSGGVGIFFGIYPARQAAKLNPIDALRFE
jgi:putative ABC transport system permease protein